MKETGNERNTENLLPLTVNYFKLGNMLILNMIYKIILNIYTSKIISEP